MTELITATFKTPEGDITARVQHTPDGIEAKATLSPASWVIDPWVLVRTDDAIEWYRGNIEQSDYTAIPSRDCPLTPATKNALRNATRAMLAWVTAP